MHNKRLYFFDWIRICAFFLLILYHTGMYYVTWDWHVKSPFASDALEPFMMLSSPWRMSLLFLVSGVAASFLLEKLGSAAFVRQRSARILLPLVFGMLVIVPPQPYFEVIEKLQYAGSYGDFMQLYMKAYHGFCVGGECIDLPTWNHLWFLPYLWVYTLLLAAVATALGQARLQAASAWMARQLSGWKIVVLPVAVIAAFRIMLLTRWGSTHDLIGDLHNHANYLTMFILGVLLSRQPSFWQSVERMRFAVLAIALVCWASMVSYYSLPEALQTWRDPMRVVYACCQWCAILAVCGFAHRHLNFDGPKRQYLTQAVFPVYILHQTVIVSFAHGLKVVHMPPVIEGIVLVVLTLGVCFAGFEAVRRVPLLRPLFGLGGGATRAPAGLTSIAN